MFALAPRGLQSRALHHTSKLYLPTIQSTPTWSIQANQYQRQLDGKRQEHDQQKLIQVAPLAHNSPTVNSGYPNIPEEQECDHKSHIRKMIVAFKDDTNNFLNEILENTIKHVEALRDETNTFLKEI